MKLQFKKIEELQVGDMVYVNGRYGAGVNHVTEIEKITPTTVILKGGVKIKKSTLDKGYASISNDKWSSTTYLFLLVGLQEHHVKAVVKFKQEALLRGFCKKAFANTDANDPLIPAETLISIWVVFPSRMIATIGAMIDPTNPDMLSAYEWLASNWVE